MEREESNNNNKQHFSHKHILTRLHDDEVKEIRCHACECEVEEERFYGCADCKYFLHEECAEAPRSIEHRSHPSHPLTLNAAATYSNQSFVCNACGHVGDGFCYSCAHCLFDLHFLCLTWPHTNLEEEEHPHELQLVCEQEKLLTPNMISICSLCDAVNTECRWIYYCETCNFGFHLHCKISKLLGLVQEDEEEEDEKEEERENEETANPEIISAGSDNEEYFSLSPSSSSSSRGINEPNSRAKTRQELEQAILESLTGMARLAQKLVVDLLNAAAHYIASR